MGFYFPYSASDLNAKLGDAWFQALRNETRSLPGRGNLSLRPRKSAKLSYAGYGNYELWISGPNKQRIWNKIKDGGACGGQTPRHFTCGGRTPPTLAADRQLDVLR